MKKLFTLNDKIMTVQKNLERASEVQLNLKIECQKALFNYKDFLKEQEQIRSKRLQKKYPEIVKCVNSQRTYFIVSYYFKSN